MKKELIVPLKKKKMCKMFYNTDFKFIQCFNSEYTAFMKH